MHPDSRSIGAVLTRRRLILRACGLAATAAFTWLVWERPRPGRGPAPLDRSPFLRDVVEPITLLDAISWDDGGSKGIRFRDARGTVRLVCLENGPLFGDENGDELPPIVVFGGYAPRAEGSRRVPIRGVEERALLGLLDRWARGDATAAELDRRVTARYAGRPVGEITAGLADDAGVTLIAVAILAKLRARN